MQTIYLFNEDGVRVAFEVSSHLSRREALVEAWRQYRELSYVDNEYPPAWAMEAK